MMLAVRHTLHLHKRQCIPKRIPWDFVRAWKIMTESIEPPLSSKIPERPCTVVLAQDAALYEACWRDSFSQVLPKERGIHYCSVAIDTTTLQEGLDELKDDLQALPNVVLVARGPFVSLVAQYYLESLPLKGLILVDPITLNHIEAPKELETRFEESTKQHEFVEEILSGKEARTLKLEPGFVPVLIFCSFEESALQQAAQDVALRHGHPDGVFGTVPVHHVACIDKADGLVAIDILTEWIDDRVL